jgi:ubiquinone/menaquinone biosynthesis C-methylase UbiE
MPDRGNPIVDTYSQLANQYDDDENQSSCWGIATKKAVASIRFKTHYRTIVDVGCGTGRTLADFAVRSGPEVRFVGVEPAANMRKRAAELTAPYPRVRIVEGSFERLPIETGSIDYLYSCLAFHWTTDLERSVSELHRVLKPHGEMDLIFIGRRNGEEFIRKTTPIFLKYMGPVLLLESASRRKQLTREAAAQLFGKKFGGRVTVEESHETYFDDLDGHWSWWVRIEGHFVELPSERKAECDREVKRAIASLNTDRGIPYTIHLLHVRVRAA